MWVRRWLAVFAATAGFVLGAAGPSASPSVQCDYGGAATCATYVQMAMVVATQQGQAVATAQVVTAQQPADLQTSGGVQRELYNRTGADLGLVVLRDSSGSVTSLILIGTTGISTVPGPGSRIPRSTQLGMRNTGIRRGTRGQRRR